MGKSIFSDGFDLRWRLLRRVGYRAVRGLSYLLGRLFIRGSVGLENLSTVVPTIYLCSYTRDLDFLILPALTRRELVFLSPARIAEKGLIPWILKTNFVLFADGEYPGYRFFREAMRSLTEYNRSVALYPDAAASYGKAFMEKYAGIIKLAMKANVPIVPVSMEWDDIDSPEKKVFPRGRLKVGEKVYISPNNKEFKDIFFKRRGFRKFGSLPKDDLQEIGRRVALRLRRVAV